MLAIALLLQYVAHGQAYRRPAPAHRLPPWIGWGLLIAGATGIGSWAFGAPFLTSTYDYPLWPLVGEVPLASAVGLRPGRVPVVVGATMVTLLSIARLSAAAARADAAERRGS